MNMAYFCRILSSVPTVIASPMFGILSRNLISWASPPELRNIILFILYRTYGPSEAAVRTVWPSGVGSTVHDPSTATVRTVGHTVIDIQCQQSSKAIYHRIFSSYNHS